MSNFVTQAASLSQKGKTASGEATHLRNAVFSKLGKQINSAKSVKEMAAVIADAAGQLLGWHVCSLHLVSESDNGLCLVLNLPAAASGHGNEGDLAPGFLSSAFAKRVAIEGAKLISKASAEGAASDGVLLEATDQSFASLLCVPVGKGGRVTGILSIGSHAPCAYSRADLGVLQSLADYCCGALDRIKAEESLRISERHAGPTHELEAAGQVAEAATQEFSNLLASVVMRLGLLRMREDCPQPIIEAVNDVERDVLGATRLIRQLSVLSERQPGGGKGNASSLRVLVVDDHPLLRSGVRQVLEQQPGIAVAGEVSNGSSAIHQALALKPDLILMDIHLPDMDGIQATRQIRLAVPACKILILSADSDRAQVDSATGAGAAGYLLKNTGAADLIRAIGAVMAGEFYISPELSAGILNDYRRGLVGERVPAKLQLSDRECKLLRLIAEGRRNKQIAADLKLSAKSIETYRARLMKKVGCSSSAELVRFAVREGIVPP